MRVTIPIEFEVIDLEDEGNEDLDNATAAAAASVAAQDLLSFVTGNGIDDFATVHVDGHGLCEVRIPD